MTTANIYTSLLNTAGIAPNQYGAEIVLDTLAQSIMLNLTESYAVPAGNTLYIPKMGTRSATALARGANEEEGVTFTAVSDTAASFTKRFVHDAISVGYATMNDLTPDRASMLATAYKAQASAALAHDIDSYILSLHASATTNEIGTAGVGHVTYDLLLEAVQAIRNTNAPGQRTIVLPEYEWTYLAKIDELIRFDVRGESPLSGRVGFRMFDVEIYTSGSCAAGHGLAFTKPAIKTLIRDLATVKEWDDPGAPAYKTLVYADYAYSLVMEDWAADINLATS